VNEGDFSFLRSVKKYVHRYCFSSSLEVSATGRQPHVPVMLQQDPPTPPLFSVSFYSSKPAGAFSFSFLAAIPFLNFQTGVGLCFLPFRFPFHFSAGISKLRFYSNPTVVLVILICVEAREGNPSGRQKVSILESLAPALGRHSIVNECRFIFFVSFRSG
jgi:hypothetical protein